MAMAYRSLRRRSIAASLTIALEDHVGRQIAAKQRPRLVSCKGSKGSCRGWRSGGGKHLGHRTARCSLRGNGSSCSARPKGPQTLPGFHTEIGSPAVQPRGGRCRFSAKITIFRNSLRNAETSRSARRHLGRGEAPRPPHGNKVHFLKCVTLTTR